MPRDRSRVHLDAGLRLDCNELMRLGVVGREKPQAVAFDFSNGARVVVAAVVENELPVLLVSHAGGLQRVGLSRDPRPFGGPGQFYFQCPRTGLRASVLWRPPGAREFACRQAWRNASYASQSRGAVDRAWAAKRRVARRLGSTDPHDYDLPEKPRWMRWRTYDRFASRYDAADDRLDQLFTVSAERFLRRHGSH